MSKSCSVCMNQTMFYVWTSTRGFPIKKFIELFDFDPDTVHALKKGSLSLPICFACAKELGYME